MKTAKETKQEILAKLNNMTDDELVEVYLNSLKSQMFAGNETIANLLARVSQLELQVQILQNHTCFSNPYFNMQNIVNPIYRRTNSLLSNLDETIAEDTK